MLNQASVAAVTQSRIANGEHEPLLKPLYESYCFANLPTSIYPLLTGDGTLALPSDVLHGLPMRYNKVILLFIDAFGWRFIERYAERYPFLRRFQEHGIVSKLSSQFPSTTSAHTTTIHTGLPVGLSGVYEWYYYEPLVDAVISPLIFAYASEMTPRSLLRSGLTPQAFFPATNIYQPLADAGVQSMIFQSRSYTPSPFGDAVMHGATLRPFQTIAEALVNLGQAVVSDSARGYYYLYIDTIDALGHVYGPNSVQFEAEVESVMTALERILHATLATQAHDTLLLVTADHGMIEVSPEHCTYLDRLPHSVLPMLRTDRQGNRLAPSGSARDLFLYAQEGNVEAVIAQLSEQLAGRATVHATEALIAAGLFGEVGERFLDRVGNVLVLPAPHEQVWIWDDGRGRQKFLGHHGGATPQEAETVLLAYAYR